MIHRAVVASLAAALVLLTLNTSEAASFSAPTGWNVGDEGSTFQQWDAFGPLDPINVNPQHVTNPALPAPTLTFSGGFIAGSGGLYSFGSDYSVRTDIANHGGEGLGTTIRIQTAGTLYDEVDPWGDDTGVSLLPDSLRILDAQGNELAGSIMGEVVRTFYAEEFEASFGIVQYEELFWEVYIPDYTGDFSVLGTMSIHSSLMSLRVDSFITPVPVPEPSTLVLLGLGLAGTGAVALRRRARR